MVDMTVRIGALTLKNPVMPGSGTMGEGLARALAFDAPSLIGVFLSGAGPSIAALVTDAGDEARAMFSSLYAELGVPAAVRVIEVHQPGAPDRTATTAGRRPHRRRRSPSEVS